MNEINLSYVITTHNKLPYLKEVMKQLLENVKEDEEIVVVDGASKDGTVEYLTELYQQGKIHQFISEPDKGEAHGYNKAMLMAKGELIKLITDDDVFYYPGIQECKRFMLEHPEVDVLGTQGGMISISPVEAVIYLEYYNDWLFTTKPFAFCGLGLLLRQKSLALTGLFHTGFIRVDAEFSYRITSGKINLAWYTGLVWLHNGNPQSNSAKYSTQMEIEMNKLEQLYLDKPFSKNASYWKKSKTSVIQLLKKVPLLVRIKRFIFPIKFTKHTSNNQTLELSNKFDFGYNWLVNANRERKSDFLHKGLNR